MKAWLAALRTRIDSMSLRERAMLFLALVAVLFTLWDMALMQPLEVQRRARLARLDQVRSEVVEVNAQVQALLDRRRSDPNAELRRELERHQSAIHALERRIGDTLKTLIAPREMARALEDVLTRQTGLKPVKVESLGAVPLLPDTAESATGVYRHRLQLTLTGGYLDAVQYLRAMQQLPWRFFWDSIEVDAGDYPRSRIVITVSTLSLSEGWIGV